MADITAFELVLYTLVAFASTTLSGMAGGGGGFITTPLLIFLGLSPAQAVASGKFIGLSVSVSSIQGMKGVKIHSRKQVIVIMAIAAVIGLGAPFVIKGLDSELYRRILGVMLLAMIPVLIWKKVGQVEEKTTPAKKIAGYGFLVVALGLQAVFSGGLGTLVNIVLMAFLGLGALEANLTKRYSQLILNTLIVFGVMFSGLVIWPVALLGAVSAAFGGYFGARIASKRGNRFVMTVFIFLMFISALELLFG